MGDAGVPDSGGDRTPDLGALRDAGEPFDGGFAPDADAGTGTSMDAGVALGCADYPERIHEGDLTLDEDNRAMIEQLTEIRGTLTVESSGMVRLPRLRQSGGVIFRGGPLTVEAPCLREVTELGIWSDVDVELVGAALYVGTLRYGRGSTARLPSLERVEDIRGSGGALEALALATARDIELVRDAQLSAPVLVSARNVWVEFAADSTASVEFAGLETAFDFRVFTGDAVVSAPRLRMAEYVYARGSQIDLASLEEVPSVRLRSLGPAGTIVELPSLVRVEELFAGAEEDSELRLPALREVRRLESWHFAIDAPSLLRVLELQLWYGTGLSVPVLESLDELDLIGVQSDAPFVVPSRTALTDFLTVTVSDSRGASLQIEAEVPLQLSVTDSDLPSITLPNCREVSWVSVSGGRVDSLVLAAPEVAYQIELVDVAGIRTCECLALESYLMPVGSSPLRCEGLAPCD